MKPSEMTNEELANNTEEFANAFHNDSDKAILREAAARLREPEAYCNCDKCVTYNAELRRRLKVAEDTLVKVRKCIDNRFNIDVCILAKNIIADTLDAIREPVTNCNGLKGGGAK